MEEAKDPKSAAEVSDTTSKPGASRSADATSSETLSDLEESEKKGAGGAAVSETGSSLEGSSPKPMTEGGGRADGGDTGGPM